MASRKILKVMQHARRGDAAAQRALGCCYLDGAEGLGRNLAAAFRWLAAAADQGDDEAARLIGERIPAAVIDCPTRARPYYESARRQGSARAATLLAQWHLAGTFGVPNAAAADYWRTVLREAAAAGDALAQLALGMTALAAGGNRADLTWLIAAGERGEAAAARQLSMHYWEEAGGELWRVGQVAGIPGEQRGAARLAAAAEALRWHVADWAGRPEAMPPGELRRRGSLLLLARRKEAGQWLSRAAAAGDGIAAYLLGIAYLGPAYLDALLGAAAPGDSPFPRSYKQAEAWLTRAAELHIAEACYAVWLLNDFRNYTRKDPGKGALYLRRAARMGHGEACWLLARGHLAREEWAEAIRWLERAVVQGHGWAEQRLAELAPRIVRPDEHLLTLARALADTDPPLAARLELGARFALAEAEYLLIDAATADLGGVLCVDIRRHYARSRMRLIRITDAAQRSALERAKQLAAGSEDSPLDYRKLRRRTQNQLARCGLMAPPALAVNAAAERPAARCC